MGGSRQDEIICQTDGNQTGSRRIVPGTEGMFNAIQRVFLSLCTLVCPQSVPT